MFLPSDAVHLAEDSGIGNEQLLQGEQGHQALCWNDGNALLRLRRMPPLFPPALWNVHDLTLTDGDRTNNFCEGWNNSFAKLVGHSHPTIWRLITHLKEDTSIMQTTVMMEARGEQPAKRVRRSSKTLQEKLKYLCTARQNGQKTVSEFLKGIGHCIRLH